MGMGGRFLVRGGGAGVVEMGGVVNLRRFFLFK